MMLYIIRRFTYWLARLLSFKRPLLSVDVSADPNIILDVGYSKGKLSVWLVSNRGL